MPVSPPPPQMLPQHRALPLDSSPNQFSLYTSPSLPNISLGLQATVTVTNSHLTVSTGHIPHLPSGLGLVGGHVLHAPSWDFVIPKALREIRRPYPELEGGNRVGEGCMAGGSTSPCLLSLLLSPLARPPRSCRRSRRPRGRPFSPCGRVAH